MERRTDMTSSFRIRLLGVLTALATTAGLLAVTSAPAAAVDPPLVHRCNYDNSTFNACLTLVRPTFYHRWVNIVAGLDAYMDAGRAREIVNRCGGQIEATLWYGNQRRRSMSPRPGWPAAGSTGLGLELYTEVVPDDDLDRYDVYATIGYFDCLQGLNGVWIHYRTGIA